MNVIGLVLHVIGLHRRLFWVVVKLHQNFSSNKHEFCPAVPMLPGRRHPPLSEDLLKAEMRSLYPFALVVQKQKRETDSRQSWKAALVRERKLLGGGQAACEHAAEIIGRDLAYMSSTSNVERLYLGFVIKKCGLRLH